MRAWGVGFNAFLLCLVLLCPGGVAVAGVPTLTSDTSTATAGYFRLSWQGGNGPYELQQAETQAFVSPQRRYQGLDQASVISGLADGTYYYRVRTAGGVWSHPVEVTVAHHPLGRALAFFAMGAVVFLATLAAILLGNRRGVAR